MKLNVNQILLDENGNPMTAEKGNLVLKQLAQRALFYSHGQNDSEEYKEKKVMLGFKIHDETTGIVELGVDELKLLKDALIPILPPLTAYRVKAMLDMKETK